ncbi:leucyl/phenylalanyl-tRNA--protein transferase|uniref:Leucyl/phenylalanyl-tRNA--protein transferase n=1 Tax=Brenneria salicis ATCC 15712 = DSM 30166 TaxID=714314 RepID=A0A366HZU1_9GAMM|nr:leucyl/phenylalanyl-tRNA--protein transferase [Brenneria salicis]NMN91360.1 leucyl/phenylalanyl-tRNA--protein transferase [Brenneria salicis ATCC 15712 = DSM 30166]RBP59987.1 leucyl/phenylalanyl-tRNA--protein transferase [Brenneria salicis ATCC 15712 = DSM 30166]RLM29957.1 leucyl/phenylalanyl-tRNA--protein transferase [Brenneria salicis ATCC 15712 = DSM 30166]
MRLYQLSSDSLYFPDPADALDEPNGLLAYGGDLTSARLKMAYRQGIFPWYSPGDPILWWSPNPRAVLFPDGLHISRSMKKFLRKHDLTATINHAFDAVITACADEHAGGTWITPEIITAYGELHKSGQAHSVEVWQNSALVGGLYGLAQGSLFCGESMFSRADNASKYALLTFQQHFIHHGGVLIDCQVLNSHTASLGVCEIPRERFLQFLFQLQDIPVDDRCWLPQTLAEPTH